MHQAHLRWCGRPLQDQGRRGVDRGDSHSDGRFVWTGLGQLYQLGNSHDSSRSEPLRSHIKGSRAGFSHSRYHRLGSANIWLGSCRGAHRNRTSWAGWFRSMVTVPVPLRLHFNHLDGRWTGRSRPVQDRQCTSVTAVKMVGRVCPTFLNSVT